MFKKIVISILIVYGVLIAGSIYYFFINNDAKDQNRIAVVDAIQLVSEFNMKKEIESLLQFKLSEKKYILDSFVSEHNKNIKNYEQEILKLNQEISYMTHNLQEEVNLHLWNRLNVYMYDYGEEHKLKVILGANGMGSILYFNDYYDHTDQVIEYVNKRYVSEID